MFIVFPHFSIVGRALVDGNAESFYSSSFRKSSSNWQMCFLLAVGGSLGRNQLLNVYGRTWVLSAFDGCVLANDEKWVLKAIC